MEGADVVATGTMTPGTVVAGAGLTADSAVNLDGSISGDIATALDGEEGVSLNAVNDIAYVHDGTVASSGDSATGILATANGNVSVSVGAISTQGAGSTGLYVAADAGAAIVTVSNVTTADDNSLGIDVYSNVQASVVCGTVATSGANSTAVELNTDIGGFSRLECGDISATGAGSLGVDVYGVNGASARVGDVMSGGAGIRVAAELGNVTLVSGNVTTTGPFATAIDAFSSERGGSVECGNLHTSGDSSHGIMTGTNDFPMSVNCGDIVTEGNASIGANLRTEGDVHIGDVLTLGANSVGVRISQRHYEASVTVGQVTTSGNGSTGIDFHSDAGEASVLTTSDISTSGDDAGGVLIDSAGSIDAHLGNVATLGDRSAAVVATSTGGSVVLAAGEVSTTGTESAGISVQGFASADVTCGNVSTSGANSDGVRVVVTDFLSGPANLACGNVSATGAGSRGVEVFAALGGSVTLGDVVSDGVGVSLGNTEGRITGAIGNVTTTGDAADGIVLLASDGTIDLTFGDVHILGDGSAGLSTTSSDGGVRVTGGDILTEGANSIGADLNADGTYQLGNVTTLGDRSAGASIGGGLGIVATLGDVRTEGDESAGIDFHSDSGGDLRAGNISTLGKDSAGVLFTAANDGDVNVTLGQVTTAGATSNGVDIRSSGGSSGDERVTLNTSGVAVEGAGSDAIRVSSRTFDLTALDVAITNSGDVTSVDGTAIFIETSGTFDMAVSEDLEVAGRLGGIIATAGRTTLDIAGAVRASEGAAIQALGGPATVTISETGSVSGAMTFGNGNDAVVSAGLAIPHGTSDFGDGSDLFTNANMVLVDGSVGFSNLERFANAGGTIDMQDGVPDDRLELSGDYEGGDGATVLLDVSRSLDAADILSIGGDVSGQTILAINFVDSNAPVNLGGVLLVDGVSDLGSFTVEGLQDFGLFALALRERDGDLYLQATVDPAVADLALLASVGPDTWYQSLDAVRASIAGRGSFLPRLGLWAQGYGARDRYGERGSADLFGFEVPASTRIETDRLGAQVGFDGSVGTLLLGATAGYEQSKSDAGVASDIDTRGFNLGAYAGFGAAIGPYASLAVKHDRLKIELSNPTIAVPDLDATATGADIEIGWRSTIVLASVDLSAGLSAVRSHIDGFSLEELDFDPGSTTSVRGRLGGRVTLAGPLAPFAGARVLHEFNDAAGIAIVGGSLRSDIDAADRGTWARIEAGIGGGVKRTLLAAWAEFGDREGLGLRAGFRF